MFGRRPSRRGVSRNAPTGMTGGGWGGCRPSRRGVSRNVDSTSLCGLLPLSRPSRRGVSRNKNQIGFEDAIKRVAPPAGA